MIFYNLLSLILFYHEIMGMKVAEFQMDGLYSDKTYMNYTKRIFGIESDIKELTSCQRINLNYLRGDMTTAVVFSTAVEDNALTIYFTKFDQLSEKSNIDIRYTD